MAFNPIFTNNDMTNYAGQETRRAVGTLDGDTLKIMNFTNYGISLMVGEEVIDYIPAYMYLIRPNDTGLTVKLDPVTSSNYIYPARTISAMTITIGPTQEQYSFGPLVQLISQGPGDTVSVAGNMTINGTPSVNIGNTPAVTVTGTPTFNIGNTPSVAIASGTVNANIQNASLNSNITNALLSTGPVAISNPTATSGTWNPGASFNCLIAIPTSFYDEFAIQVTSTNSLLSNFDFTLDQLRYVPPGVAAASFESPGGLFVPFANNDNNNKSEMFRPIKTTSRYCINFLNIVSKNARGATALTDTLTITVFAKYASANIDNGTTAPVPILGVNGSPISTGTFVVTNSGPVTVVPSGGILNRIIFSVYNNGGAALPANAALNITNGGNPFLNIGLSNLASLQAITPFVAELTPGVANNGIACLTGSGNNLVVAAYAIKQ